MENSKKLTIKPTAIARNTIYGNNGELEDLVNARFIDGGIRPVQRGKKIGPVPFYNHIVIHTVSDQENWIGYKSNTRVVQHFNHLLSTVNQTLVTLASGETMRDMKSFRNYLIITTSVKMYRFLFTDGSYVSMNIETPIKIGMTAYDYNYSGGTSIWTTHGPDYTDNDYDCSKELIANIYEKLNDESANEGRIHGGINWIAAYRLVDNSFILHTEPVVQVGAQAPVEDTITEGEDFTSPDDIKLSSHVDGRKTAAFYTKKWRATINPQDYISLVNEEKIISSVCVFFSKPLIRYDIEKSITNDNLRLTLVDGDPVDQLLSDIGEINDDWNSKADPELGWFLVAEIPFKSIIDAANRSETTFETESYFKLDNFYQNYATRESLKVDQYSHHTLTAGNMFVYNSRLWCTEISRKLALPEAILNLPIADLSSDVEARVVVRLLVDQQKISVCSDPFTLKMYMISTGIGYIHFPVLSYPDDRAYEISIYVNYLGAWKEFTTLSMVKSTLQNFSYYFDNENDMGVLAGAPGITYDQSYDDVVYFGLTHNLATANDIDTSIFNNPNITDTSQKSQVQLTELNNPFVFPAKLNYPVGTGTVNYFAVTVNALSEGQFGMFPVIVFTSSGIYAMELGMGEVVVSNVTPVSPDIAVGSPLSTDFGIFYITRDAIKRLVGREPQDISKPLRGKYSELISRQDPFFLNYSSHPQITTLGYSVTTMMEFKTMINDLVLGFDNDTKRIIATKSGMYYSFVFDLETNLWYKLSESYDYFVMEKSKLYGLNGRGIIDLSDLTDTETNIQIHFRTNILNFDTDSKKKINGSILRCRIQTEHTMYSSFCVFGSNDGITWQMLTGNDRKTGLINDIRLTKNHGSYTYFVYAFWGEIKANFDNVIDKIDADVSLRYTHRL